MTDAQVTLSGVSGAAEMSPMVFATNGRGLNPNELAHMLLDKTFFVSKDAPPAVMEQAVAYRNKLYRLFVHYFAQAQKSQNTTIYNVLMEAGETRAAELVKEL